MKWGLVIVRIEKNLPYHKSGSYFQQETKMISEVDALTGEL